MKYLLTILIVLLANLLPAQNLTQAVKSEVVDSLSRSLIRNYVYLDTAIKMSTYIKKCLREGSYDRILNPKEFAQALTMDLRRIYNDAHLSITFDPQMLRALRDTSKTKAAQRRQENFKESGRQNFGFKKMEILNGNIGYVSFDRFYGFNDLAKEVVNTVFSFFKNVDALIIDLRNNGGGSPDMDRYISSFFLPPHTQLSGLYERRTNETETAFTYQPSVSVSFADKPLYILVNRRTFSAAEVFSYDLQNLHKATIIGEITGGGAHAVEPNGISNGFIGLIPFARAISPVTGTNFEGIGVKPDIKVSADSSLDAAILSYYDYQLANTEDSGVIKKISWPRDFLKAKLHPYYTDSTTAKTYIGNFAGRMISFENGILWYLGRDGKKTKLVSLFPGVYKMEGIDNMKIEFVKNETGKINDMNFIFEDGFVASYKRKE